MWPSKLWHSVLIRVLNRIWMNQSCKSYCFQISFIYSERRGNLHSLQSHCLLCDGKKTFACVSATKRNRVSPTCGYLSSLICSCKALDCCIARKYKITTFFQWLIFAALISNLHPAAQFPGFYGNTISVHFNAKSCCNLSEDIVSSS